MPNAGAHILIGAARAAVSGQPYDELPPPWLAWLVVCLCRQRARQSWLMNVAAERLGDFGPGDAGDVPDLAGWSFEFHGSGLCLMGPGSELLDVDFYDDGGATIDPFFFARRVLELDPKPFPEARLSHWLPSEQLIVTALDALRDTGTIGHPVSRHVFRLCEGLERMHGEMSDVDFDDPTVCRLWAARFGDDRERPEVSAAFDRWLFERLEDRKIAARILDTLPQLVSEPDVVAVCRRIVTGPIDAATGRALEVLDRVSIDATALVAPLLDRFEPARHHPYPVWAAARYLLTRGKHVERCLQLVEAFAAVEVVSGYTGNPYADYLAVLMLEHEPARALPLIRRALGDGSPAVVQGMAALLALLDQRWCHRELQAALRRCQGERRRGLSLYLVAALAHSTSDVARRRAQEIAPDDGGLGFTFDDVIGADLESVFPSAIDRVRPVADRLRDALPDNLA